MKEYLLVCKVLKPVGLKGDLKVYTYTTFKDIRYKKGSKLFYKNGEDYIELTVKSFYSKGGNLDVISFKDLDEIDKVNFLLGKEIYALKDDSILNENEFYYSDLTGLKVIDEDNNELGKVTSIEEFPAQITLKIQKNSAKSHFFVPFNDFFVKEVNIKDGFIKIHLIDGLL